MRRSFLLFVIFYLSVFAVAAENKEAAVTLKGQTLFYIYASEGNMDVAERAMLISSRLEKLVDQPSVDTAKITLDGDSMLKVIYYDDRVLIRISPADAAAMNTSLDMLANSYSGTLKMNIQLYTEQHSIQNLLVELLLVALVVVVLFFLIYLLNKLFRWLRYKLIVAGEQKLESVEFKGYKPTSTRQLIRFMLNALKIAKVIVILFLVYLSLPVIFSIFPWTEPIADKLLGYIISPFRNILFSFLHYIPNFLTILVIYIVTRYIIKAVHFISKEIENGTLRIEGFHADWAATTFNLVRAMLYVFMFIAIFPYLPGSDSKVFQGVSVFLGVLLSLGSSSAISNIIAGIVLTYMRPYQIEDCVKINDCLGNVTQKNLLVTRVRTFKNEDITIPNSTILNSHTVNYTLAAKESNLILHTSVSIGYDTPWKRVHELLINAAKKSGHILRTKEPFVLQSKLDDFYAHYELNVYVDNTDLLNLYSEIHERIQDEFNQAGVEIMSPHFRGLRDGNTVNIPSEYLHKDYEAPGFRVDKQK